MIDFTVDNIKSLSEVGFLFVFSISSLAGVAVLARYIARLFQQKERQIESEHKLRDQLLTSNMEVVKNNTEAFKDLSFRLTELVQEARHNHKEIMTHLTIVTASATNTSKNFYQRSSLKETR